MKKRRTGLNWSILPRLVLVGNGGKRYLSPFPRTVPLCSANSWMGENGGEGRAGERRQRGAMSGAREKAAGEKKNRTGSIGRFSPISTWYYTTEPSPCVPRRQRG